MNQCRNEGCERPIHVKHAKLCRACYEKHRREREVRPCCVPDCDQPMRAKGMCWKHYERLTRSGRLEDVTVAERIQAKVVVDDNDCWLWTDQARGGYPYLSVKSAKMPAHRLAYEIWVGPIPEELQIDHLCRNKMCVNPAHLEPVTQRENILRSDNMAAKWARRTECEKCGGPLTELYGRRRCVPCFREANRQRYLRRKTG